MEKKLSLKEIKDLVKLDEGYNLEFKEKAISSIKDSICAFANSDGGLILVGVKDDKSIVGLKDIKENMLKISNYLSNLNPTPIVDYYKVRDLIVLSVPKQLGGNIFTSDNVTYIREGETNRKLSIEDLIKLLQERRKVNFDTKLNNDFSFDSDFNNNSFKKFLELSKIRDVNEKDYLQILKNLGFTKDGVINNTGILFFSNKVEKFLLNAKVNIVEYDENEEVFEIKKLNYDFYSNLVSVEEILRNKLNVKFNIEGFLRKEQWEIPRKVLREVILNAMGHRDYNSSGVVQIDIFKDRIEVYNPGGLIDGLKKEDLGKFGSRPRNLFLFSMLDKMNLVDNIGSGIKRVRRALEERSLNYEYEVESNYFKFTIFREKKTQNVGKNVGKNVARSNKEKRQDFILEKIKNEEKVTISLLANEIGVNTKTIERDLEELKSKDLIEFIGEKRIGTWKLKK